MIEAILIDQAGKIYDQLPFPYRVYKHWQNEENEPRNRFVTVGSSTSTIRAREKWNTLGREIYDPKDVERHADIVSQILFDMQLSDFFVQQIVPSAAWFSGNTEDMRGRANDMVAYLESRSVSVDFSIWRGILIVRREIGDFLRHFLDYPFILKSYELEVFALQAPLVITINHHLSLEYTSSDSSLVDEVKNRVVTKGILEYPDRGTSGHS